MVTPTQRITIKDLGTGQSCEVDVHGQHLISDIVVLVIDAWDLPSGHRMLTRNNEEVLSDQTVDEAGLEEGDILVLAPDPVGGAELPTNVWRTRLQHESDRIREAKSYRFDVKDDGPPLKNRRISVYLKDAPAYRKVDDTSDPVLATEHTLEIALRRGFPDDPPEVRIVTDIFHPNIYADSKNVCIGMLGAWDQSFTIIELIKAIDVLLWNPNLSDPADRNAAKFYEHHPIEPPARTLDAMSEASIEIPPIRIVSNDSAPGPRIVTPRIDPPPPRIIQT